MSKAIKETTKALKKLGTGIKGVGHNVKKPVANLILRMTSKNKLEEEDIAALKQSIKANPEDFAEDTEYEGESDISPLHLAVLTNAEPEVIECLLQVDEVTVHKMTSTNRTALDIAKEKIKDKEYTEESTPEVQNAFATVSLIETAEKAIERRKQLAETVKLTDDYLANYKIEPIDESVDKESDAKSRWGKLKTTVMFASHLLKNHSSLGPKVEKDSLPAVCPPDFNLPPNLERTTVDEVLPVGFNRLRCALLHGSEFMEKEYYAEKMLNTEIKVEGWDKHNDHIGKEELPKDVSEKYFISAERKQQYKMPKTLLVSANTAYGTTRLIEYNDYCFAVKMVTTNPEVPYGKKFEAHTQWVFVNDGNYHCRMIGSVTTEFPKGKPMIGWKIKDGMFAGCSAADVALGEVLCAHAGSE